jgi:peptidoglycan/xylan/chitin deacetylase (PgdA/CDA1 family)
MISPSASHPRVPFELSSSRRRLTPPGGKPIIVHLVVNIECWPFDEPMPRQMLTPPHGRQPRPDVPNFSWAEYGMRCGVPRLIELFRRLDVRASTTINAAVLDLYPALADAIRDAGWEFIGHGYIQRSLQQEPDERAVIRASLDRLTRCTGKRTRGWLGPGLHETDNTPDILKEEGVDYVCDWVLDDLPCWLRTAKGALIAMPYALELNDVVIYAVEKHPADEIAGRVVDTLSVFERECRGTPRLLVLALHPYAVGVPHRLPYLERALKILKGREDAVFLTGSEIADWFAAVEPAPSAAWPRSADDL